MIIEKERKLLLLTIDKCMKKLPFVYCAECRTCRHRKFKNLFDVKSMLDCADCNGLAVQTIIPFILWRVSWCKLYKKKKEGR